MHPIHVEPGVRDVACQAEPPGTRRGILDAAAHLLATKGYTAFRVHEVAALAAVHPSAIYYYFGSRDDLVEEILWHGMSSLRREVAAALAQCSATSLGVDRLAKAVEAHLRIELGITDYAQASVRNAGHVPEALRRRNVDEQDRYRELWEAALEAAVADGSVPAHPDRHLALRFALGSLNWTAEWASPKPADIATLTAVARAFVCHGLIGSAAPHDPVELGCGSPDPNRPDATTAKTETSTRGRLLAAGAWTLRHHGYSASRLADIAEIAAVRAPAIYHHFPSRQALLVAVMTEGHRAVHAHVSERLAALPDTATARDAISAAVAAHLDIQLELSDFTAAAVRNTGQTPVQVRAATAAAAAPYDDLWRNLLTRASAEGQLRDGIDPITARMLIHGTLNWATEWWHPGISIRAAAQTGERFVVSGLLRESGPSA